MNPFPILESTSAMSPPGSGDEPRPSKGRFCFISLGCPKNLVDSEKMLGTLAIDGYTLVSEPEGADFVVVNTCGFIEQSRKESRDVIEEMLSLKRSGKTGGVIVAGCLPQRLGGAKLLEEMPEIDQLVGVFAREEIARAADRIVGVRHKELAQEQREVFRPAPIRALDDRERLRITPRHYAYLKISEGCNRTCTFCSIPMMRGKHATKPIELVVSEARELAADGARELILVAQDLTYYGMDLYGEVRLVQLLNELEKIEGIEWIRLMYLYPVHVTDPLIEKIASSTKVLPYLDLPLQHVSTSVLRRMSRRIDRDKTVALVEKLRGSIPNLVLRTTFIVGFPGETDRDFEELKDFVETTRFERMGVFTYSQEPGTPAMRLDGHLPEELKEARQNELMATQQEIAFEFAESLLGYELDVVIDGPAGENLWAGRTYADAPDIDATVYVAGEKFQPGEKLPVVLAGRDGYDWIGEIADDES
ncbi:MAG: 30S ribosomal protein S12 methylthiotransferase RimO [Planctomycetaceae bacterium]|nr:30S ribosomal protein S12 methylthiotransferase RimO [Planctomycetaceae bacterium]